MRGPRGRGGYFCLIMRKTGGQRTNVVSLPRNRKPGQIHRERLRVLNPLGLPRFSEQTRQAIDEHLRIAGRRPGQFLFAGRRGVDSGLTTRQYARLVGEWIAGIGLDPLKFGTHSLRRTKATLIYRRTGNLRAVQLLLGHTKIESTVRYLGVEIDDAIEIAEKIDV